MHRTWPRVDESEPGLNRQPRAFSLLELLISMGVIAVLMGITLPLLSSSNKRAHDLEMMVNQRESLLLLCTYAFEHDGEFPSFGQPNSMIAPLRWGGETLDLTWWEQMEYWGLALQSQGYDGWITLGPQSTPTAFDRLSCSSCGQGRSIHLLTAAAFGDPSLFSDGESDRREWHAPQTIDNVAHPSDKGLIIHLRGLRDARVEVGFADGHVERVAKQMLIAGVKCEVPYSPLPVAATRAGLLGRDR